MEQARQNEPPHSAQSIEHRGEEQNFFSQKSQRSEATDAGSLQKLQGSTVATGTCTMNMRRGEPTAAFTLKKSLSFGCLQPFTGFDPPPPISSTPLPEILPPFSLLLKQPSNAVSRESESPPPATISMALS